MAVKLLTGQLTVAEQMKRIDPDGNAAKIAEVIEEVNEILIDAPMYQANEIRSHVATIRTRYPTVKARRINKGAYRGASGTRQLREYITLLETWVEIDEQIIDKDPDPKKARVNEVKAFIEATLQEFSRQFFYGNVGVDEGEIDGLITRYNALALDNVEGASGTGSDLSSLLLIEYGENTLHLLYPRGHKSVGITDEDKGKQTKEDADGNPFDVYRNKIIMEFGLTVKDDKAFQRIANIESTGTTNNLIATGGMGLVVDAMNRLPKMGENAIMYMNRSLKSQFDKYALDKANLMFSIKELSNGRPATFFMNMPMRHVDQLLSTEDAIT